jgi:hypothetical protein
VNSTLVWNIVIARNECIIGLSEIGGITDISVSYIMYQGVESSNAYVWSSPAWAFPIRTDCVTNFFNIVVRKYTIMNRAT